MQTKALPLKITKVKTIFLIFLSYIKSGPSFINICDEPTFFPRELKTQEVRESYLKEAGALGESTHLAYWVHPS